MSRSTCPFTRFFTGVILAAALGAAGCGGAAVPLAASEYSPRLQDQTGSYRGTHLYLVTPVNEAENTSIFYYYAVDGSARYGGPALTSYLWYGLEKAFSSVGIVVHEEKPQFPAPELDLTFSSWTDREFLCAAKLVSPRPFQRMMKVEFGAAPAADAPLEQRQAFAYGQLDAIAVNLLGDPEFLASMLAAQPPPGAVPAGAGPAPAPVASTPAPVTTASATSPAAAPSAPASAPAPAPR